MAAPIICIDPGHPSEIADALNIQNGTSENHCNWVVALRLRRRLEAASYQIVMTKQAERQLVTNRRRAEIANAARAVVMVRLHCDTGTGSGFCVYYPKEPGRHQGNTGPSPQVCQDSRRAADALHAGLAAGLTGILHDNGVKTDRSTAVGRRFGALIGSIYSHVPTVTIEMVMLTNRGDATFIKSEAGQQKLADALADGIHRFVATR